jgi:DNA-binding transcriptional LysR family regulator
MTVTRKPNLKALDLNLLRVFDALEQERSVTGAGRRLNITQSAISHALNRLRLLLDDELIVRSSDGMIPTPRAIEIAPRLHKGLMQITFALDPPKFVPADSKHRFTLACHSHVSTVLLPHVMARLRRDAPGVELHVRPIGVGIVADFDAARTDISIGDFRHIPDRFDREQLMTDRVVWAIRADHPLADGEFTIEKLCSLPQIVLAAGDPSQVTADGFVVEEGLELRAMRTDDEPLRSAFASLKKERIIRMSVPDSPTALAVAGSTDIAALVPLRLAQSLALSYRVRLFNPPYASAPSQMILVWHRSYGEQSAVAWLRSVIRSVAASVEAGNQFANTGVPI